MLPFSRHGLGGRSNPNTRLTHASFTAAKDARYFRMKQGDYSYVRAWPLKVLNHSTIGWGFLFGEVSKIPGPRSLRLPSSIIVNNYSLALREMLHNPLGAAQGISHKKSVIRQLEAIDLRGIG